MQNHADVIPEDWQKKLAEPIDLAALSKLDIPKMDWIVENMFAVGQSGLLTSSTGKGKSLNAQLLGMQIALGKPFGHYLVSKPRKVMYLDGEMHPIEFKERQDRCSWITDRDWEKLTQNFYYWNKLYGENFPDLSDKETWSYIQTKVVQEEFDLVIIDNYFSMTRMKDYNAPQEAQKLQDLFIDPLKAFGISILMVDHLSKSGHEYGTIVKQAGVEFILRISYDKESGLFTLASQKGRSLGMGQSDMTYRISTEDNTITALDIESVAVNTKEHKLVTKNLIGNKFKELYEKGAVKTDVLKEAIAMYMEEAEITDIGDLGFKFQTLRTFIPLWLSEMGYEGDG